MRRTRCAIHLRLHIKKSPAKSQYLSRKMVSVLIEKSLPGLRVRPGRFGVMMGKGCYAFKIAILALKRKS